MREELTALLERDTPITQTELLNIIETTDAVDVAEIFSALDTHKAVALFRKLPKDTVAEVFSYIDLDKQQDIIERLSDTEAGHILNNLFADDATDLLEEMPVNVVKRLLQNVTPEKRQTINQLLKYPEDSAGSVMTVEYVELDENFTVKDAFEKIRKTGVNKETIYTCYVASRDHVLKGVVSVKDLLLSPTTAVLSDIMSDTYQAVGTHAGTEHVSQLFKKYSLLSLPVLDGEGRLVGIITVDDVVTILEEEVTEDIEKMAALTPSETPYLQTGVIKLSANRIIWLLVLMVSAMLTGGIIEGYEASLGKLPILMAFIPMLMDTGGNAGSQSATLVIRGLALGEIRKRDVLVVLFKELRVALVCSVILGAVNFARVMIFNQNVSVVNVAMLSLTVTLSLCATVIMAKTVGCLLPIGAKAVKMDPAIMASPLITTIVDAASLVVYFTIAKALLHF